MKQSERSKRERENRVKACIRNSTPEGNKVPL
uniref:Uncharacterized protein n=1 Tax=Anguilla anguilla TaxID=7936 RepID=A0A0E9S990_ANGAN